MIYVVAFFCAPLACLMAGRFLEFCFSAVLWGSAVAGVVLLFPVGFVLWLLGLAHVHGVIQRAAKLDRLREQNALLRAQGRPEMPEPRQNWGTLAAIALAVFSALFFGFKDIDAKTRSRNIEAKEIKSSVAAPVPPSSASPAAPANIHSWTYAAVVSKHGEPAEKDKASGWARWPAFRARFADGKVVEVAQP